MSFLERSEVQLNLIMNSMIERFELMIPDHQYVDADIHPMFCVQLTYSKIVEVYSFKIFFKDFLEVKTLTVYYQGLKKEDFLATMVQLTACYQIIDRVIFSTHRKDGTASSFLITQFNGWHH